MKLNNYCDWARYLQANRFLGRDYIIKMNLLRLTPLCLMTIGKTPCCVAVLHHHIPLVPHHILETRQSFPPLTSRGRYDERNLKRQSDKQQQIDALYQGYGTHYVDLWVGTPPQRQTVIVGTGSSAIAFPCSECTVCGELHHTDSYFIESDSLSFSKVPCGQCKFGHCATNINAPDSNLLDECEMRMSYAEGSTWKAFEGIDITYAGGPHDKFQALHSDHNLQTEDDLDPSRASSFAFNLTFGCQTYTSGLFSTQLADGIMGMDNAPDSFWAQAYDHGMIDKKSFSLCLSRQPIASWQGTEAGALTMGGMDHRLHKSPMVFCYLEPGSNFVVDMRKVHLRQGGGGDSAKTSRHDLKTLSFNYTGRTSVKIGRGQKVVIDSGTTDTYLTRELAPAFQKAWKLLTGTSYTNDPVTLTEVELNSLPTILFQLAGDEEKNKKVRGAGNADQVVGLAGSLDPEHPLDVIVAMPPTHYMQYDKNYQKYVPRFYLNEMWDPVLGANAMMGHDINFNEEENHIGWAESLCDYTELVDEFEEEELAEQVPKPGAEPKVSWEESEPSVPQAKVGSNARGGICNTFGCKGGLTVVSLAVLVVTGVLVRKRLSSAPLEARYQPTAGMEILAMPTHGNPPVSTPAPRPPPSTV